MRKYFGTDGIRDVAGQGLLAPVRVQALGQAIGAWLAERGVRARVLAGRDTRASGVGILDDLARGIVAGGHRLVDGGVLTTPGVQALCREEGFDLALVISASHNPARDNGIKLFGADGRKLGDAAESRLEELMDQPPELQARGGERSSDPDASHRYVKFIRQVCPNLDLRGVRLVVDCAHGAASLIAPELLERFGAHVVLLGAEPDGTNINDGAGVFHVGGLGPIVRKTRASLGLALDGDADRVLLVDETGEVRDGDHMLGILAEDLLRRGLLSGHRVVTTIMANLGLLVHLKRLAVTCDLVPVGDRYVAARMAESGAAVGGEQSGHVIFNESPRWFGDGLYTALRVLEIIGRTGRPLSDLAAGVEKFPQVLKNVTVVRKPPLDSLVPLREATRAAEAELEGEGRVVLRYSGTEPLLRVMVEGRSQSRIEVLADHLAAVAARAIGG